MRNPGSVDRVLLVAVALLCLFGLVMLYSSSVIFAEAEYGSKTALLRSQAGKFVLGWVVLLVLCRMSYRRLNGPVALWMYGVTVGLMGLSLLFPAVNNVQRRIGIGALSAQPVEFARLAMVIFLAHFVSESKDWKEGRWRGLFYPLAAVLGLAVLAKLQPNLSSAVLIAALGVGILYAAGQPVRRLVLVLAPLVAAVLAAMEPYQLKRITDFVSHRGGDAPLPYQVEQSLIALGSGGFSGAGVGQGLQKYLYLPFPHSDFILGVVGEETGFRGLLILFGLYLVVILRGLRIARLVPDRFGQTLAIGLTLSLMLNFVLHSVVVMGLGPVTGVPLPFVSHGGSSLLANLVAVGLLLALSRSARPEPLAQPSQNWSWMGSPSRAD